LLRRDRVLVGRLLAAFFVAVFPGNLAQFMHKRDGFGLDTDARDSCAPVFSQGWSSGHSGRPRYPAGCGDTQDLRAELTA
jgi:hypothetical protein